MDLQALYYLLSAVLVAVGVAGVVLPALPGVPLVFAGMLLAAWAGDFERVGAWPLVALGALTVLSVIVDVLASVLGAQRAGASRMAIVGAAIGSIVGLFFGLAGLLLGPFVGALAGEWLHGRQVYAATRVGVATWIGLVVGAAVKIAVVFAMLGIFAFAWFV